MSANTPLRPCSFVLLLGLLYSPLDFTSAVGQTAAATATPAPAATADKKAKHKQRAKINKTTTKYKRAITSKYTTRT